MVGAPPYHMMPPHPHGHAPHGYPPNMQMPPHMMQHPGYPPHPHQARMPPVGYPPHPYHPNMPPPPGYPIGYPPNMQYRPPPPHGYPAYPMPQQQQKAADPKNNGHRRREYEVDRPAKRQKTAHHDDRDYRRSRGLEHRKKHRSKHEKRHKNRGRGRGRRSNKEGMQIDHHSGYFHTVYHAKTCFSQTSSRLSVVEYFDDDEEQTEYLFVFYMFAFLAFCYAFFGKTHGMIW